MGVISEQSKKKIIEWMFCGRTGISSETMAAIALGVEGKASFGFGAPHDPSDFGRCYGLVKVAPEIKNVFSEISEKVPEFAGILSNWDELCGLYERDLSLGRSSELYDRIKELRGDRR